MPKTKEELLAMSQEDLAEYALKNQIEAKEAFEKRDAVKAEIKTLKSEVTKLTNSNAELTKVANEFNNKAIIEKLNGMNIQEKFIQDMINKGELKPDMEEAAFNEAVSKVLETYPEYKTNPTFNKPIDVDKLADHDPILDSMKQHVN